MRKSQRELIIDFVREFGSITPAKMSGKIYNGIMFGHSVDARCRDLRRDGLLVSTIEGKFSVFIPSTGLQVIFENE